MSVLNITTVGGIRILELNRPEKRNALNDELIEALKAALTNANTDQVISCVVIRGAGKDFCSGADLSSIQKMATATYEENLEDARRLGELFKLIRSVRMPVIAAVRGRALAGGCGLAMSCDLVISDSTAIFGYPEVKIGFVPAMVAAIVRRNMFEKKSFAMLTRGFEMTAGDLHGIGLVDRIFPDEAFDDEVMQYASIYDRVSRSAVEMTKRLFYEVDGMTFHEAVDRGAEANAKARMTEDCKRGIAKFLEK
jgi:methylglutaconyl-CoA hydratase